LYPRPLTSTSSTFIIDSNDEDSRIFPEGSKWNEDNYGPIRIPKKDDVISITPKNFKEVLKTNIYTLHPIAQKNWKNSDRPLG
jgi:hypothetical protein